MWWALKRFGRGIAAASTFLGILYFAKDAYELPEALKVWGSLMPDRETLFALLAGLLVVTIVWNDVRPIVRQYWARRKHHPLLVEPVPYSECQRIASPGTADSGFFARTFYAVVQNDDKDGKTIRNVSASVRFIGPANQCRIRGSEATVSSIRPGERLMFKLGMVASANLTGGFLGQKLEVDEQSMSQYQHNIPLGHLVFEAEGGISYGLSLESNFNIELAVVCDDAAPQIFCLNVGRNAQHETVEILVPTITNLCVLPSPLPPVSIEEKKRP